MAKQLLEINKFQNGTVTTPDATDTPEQSASFSINLDCVNKDGVLQGAPINATKVIKNNDASTNAAPDIDKARVIKSLRSDGTVKEDVVYWEDDSKKINFISNVDKEDNSTRLNHDDNSAVFPAAGKSFHVNTPLVNVAMETHNKEVHMGLGEHNAPQWVGYTNHKGLRDSAKILVSEDAEVKYPSSLPYIHKMVLGSKISGGVNDSYFYGIEKGGTRIWKIDGSANTTTSGTRIAASTKGTFNNLQSIASDPATGRLYVLDNSNNGYIYEVSVDNLDEKDVTYTLPSTYPGAAGTSYSDIEFTSGGSGKIWLAAHYDSRTGAAPASSQFLWKIDYNASSSSPTLGSGLTNMMPRMQGGSNTTTGTWVQIDNETQEGYVEQSEVSPMATYIAETFPISLLKHPSDNDAIYWLARYPNTESDGEYVWKYRWLNRTAAEIQGGTSGDVALTNVDSITVIRTLCLHRIKHDHTAGTNNSGGDFVPLTSVYDPGDSAQNTNNFSAVNIDSIGIDNNGDNIYLTIGDKLERLTENLDITWTGNQTSGDRNVHYLVAALYANGPSVSTTYNVTPTGQSARTGVKIHFGYVPSTGADGTSDYVAANDNIVLLRQTSTAGFDKIGQDFSANATQTFFKDHSVLGLVPTYHSSDTGELLDGYSYFYKATMIYDGYQETPLSREAFVQLDHTDTKNNIITITINDYTAIPKRASAIKIYRAESQSATATIPTSFYRLVKVIPFSRAWSASGVSYSFVFDDNGIKGASFEAESGLAETLESTLPRYSLSTQLNNQHYIAKCWHDGYVDDASSYVFVSKVGKFDVFDWLVDFIKLPTVPTALTSFAGRVYAFDELNTYRMRGSAGGQGLYIEDVFEGVGCLNDDAVVSTDFGLFFADNNNIYQHNGRSAEPIGEAIVRGDSTYSWQNRDTSYYTRAIYDAKRRSVYFTFKAGNNYYAWAWNIPRKRWDMLSFGDTEGTLQPKGVYLLNDTSMNVGTGTSVVSFLGQTGDNFTDATCDTTNNDATITVDSTTNIKAGMYVYGTGIPTDATVLSITNATTFELSANATASNTNTTLTFSKKRLWTWVSKDLTMGNDTQQKAMKEILLNSRIKANFTTNSAKPSAGSQVANTLKNGTFRKAINTKATNLKIRLDANAAGDELGAVGVLFRLNRIPS